MSQAAAPSSQFASRPQRGVQGGPKPRIAHSTGTGEVIVDWKDTEALRRFLSPNGKIQGRRRNGASAREQRMLSQAIKRARFMALIPYTSATV